MNLCLFPLPQNSGGTPLPLSLFQPKVEEASRLLARIFHAPHKMLTVWSADLQSNGT